MATTATVKKKVSVIPAKPIQAINGLPENAKLRVCAYCRVSSDNPDYISVDNTGKVMGVSLGQAIITAKLIDHEYVQDDITITVVEILNHQYTINIVGDSNIKTGQSKSYASHIYDNGLEVDDKQIAWTMRNQDNSTPVMASITSSTEADATIKAESPSGNVGKYIILKATLVEDNTVFNEHTIRITGLW